ncbi:MAG: hypothetical protein AABY16_03380 [Nanoarchaeota archaeon]
MLRSKRKLGLCGNRIQLRDAVPYVLRRASHGNWTRNLVQRESYNRRGNLGSGILYSVFFLMMLMIAGGIVGGTYAFFGKGYDFRATEAEFLFSRIQSCFEKNNFFDSGFVEQPELFYEKCALSSEVLEDGEHLVYVKRISDGKEFFAGVYDFTVRCGLDARFKNKGLPLCEPRERRVIGGYEFIVGSSQNSRRTNA